MASDRTSNLFGAQFLHFWKGDDSSHLKQLPGSLDETVHVVGGISLIRVRIFSFSFALEQDFVDPRTFLRAFALTHSPHTFITCLPGTGCGASLGAGLGWRASQTQSQHPPPTPVYVLVGGDSQKAGNKQIISYPGP